MARHFVGLLPAPGEGWRFVTVDRGGVSVERADVMPSGSDEVTIIVPATEVALAQVRLVGNRRADWLRAARFAVEDDVSVPVETLHVAIDPRRKSGEQAGTCLVSKALMDEWMARLAEAGLEDAHLVPDVTLLPAGAPPQDVGRHIIFAGEGVRLAIDKSLPEELVSVLLDKAGHRAETPDDVLLLMAGYIASGETGIDLRQAEFARKAELPVDFKRFRLLAGLAAALAVVWGLYTFASIQTMKRLEAELTQQTRDTFTALFPGEPVPSNILTAVRQRSGGPEGRTASFRQMTGILYAALGQAEGTRLSSLRYDAETGQLQAKLVYGAFGDDEALKASIETGGLSVRLGDARVEDGRVVGDLILELPS
ncbi:type II secretion system protein GspL [Hyphomonas sp.]|uniref:type II secretion system protein GspL n=1 Tax=Hyphomonas sp. TaxID=87 RepID=UPI003242561D